jgi:hypothetical protein
MCGAHSLAVVHPDRLVSVRRRRGRTYSCDGVTSSRKKQPFYFVRTVHMTLVVTVVRRVQHK